MENKQKLSRFEEIKLIEEYLMPIGESLDRNELVQAKIKFDFLCQLVQKFKEENKEKIKEEPEDLPDLDDLPPLISDHQEEVNEPPVTNAPQEPKIYYTISLYTL